MCTISFHNMIIFLESDSLVLASTSQLNRPPSPPLVVSNHTTDNLSPLTAISDDDDDEAFYIIYTPYPQVVINTNFDPYLEGNRIFPCGKSDEERLDFTKRSREDVEDHAVTPSTLKELASMVCQSFPSSCFLLLSICKLQDQLKTGKRENTKRDFIRINPNILEGYAFF